MYIKLHSNRSFPFSGSTNITLTEGKKAKISQYQFHARHVQYARLDNTQCDMELNV